MTKALIFFKGNLLGEEKAIIKIQPHQENSSREHFAIKSNYMFETISGWNHKISSEKSENADNGYLAELFE